MSFKKQKQIFCKREEYLKSYSKKIKKNIFSIEKEEESKIKQAMEEKKREIIENLMDKLKFLWNLCKIMRLPLYLKLISNI